MRWLSPWLYGGNSTGKPAVPLAAAGSGVGRHEGPNRKNPGRRVAIAVNKSHGVGEPRVVDQKATGRRIAGHQHEVLVATQLDFGHDGAAGVEFPLDQPHVWTEPPGEGYQSACIRGAGAPDQLVIVGVAAISRQPSVERPRVGVDPVVAQ